QSPISPRPALTDKVRRGYETHHLADWRTWIALRLAWEPRAGIAYNGNMTYSANQREPLEAFADLHLLGEVDFDAALALQRRLVFEAGERHAPRISVLLCEHPELITVGRDGSRGDIRLSPDELRERR